MVSSRSASHRLEHRSTAMGYIWWWPLFIMSCALLIAAVFPSPEVPFLVPASAAEWEERLNINCGKYTCDMATYCPLSYEPRWTDAAALCSSRSSEGWMFASIPTLAARDAARRSGYSVAVGGSDAAEENVFRWLYGRSADAVFSRGSTPQAPYVAPWAAGEPDNYENEDYVFMQPNGLFSDGKAATTAPCVACERSQCTAALDCNPAGAASAYGWYPNCTCVCADGYYGLTCQYRNPFVVITAAAAISELSMVCHAYTMNFSTARAQCLGKGEGWDVATVTAATSYTTLNSMAGNYSQKPFFLGAQLSADGTAYVWEYGRRRRLRFTSTTDLSCLAPPCYWDGTQSSGGGRPYLVQQYPEASASKSWRTVAATAGQYCVACERSPCAPTSALAQLEAGTLIPYRYFPQCTETQTIHPSATSTLTRGTPSGSHSTSRSRTITSSLGTPSQSSTRTASSSITDTATLTVSLSASGSPPSATQSDSATATVTLSMSASSTESPTTTDTSTITVTQSESATDSASASLTATETLSLSASLSETHTCPDIPHKIAMSTCLLMVPSAGTINDFDTDPTYCLSSDVPFSHWGGREGGVFEIDFLYNTTILEVDQSHFIPPTITGPFKLLHHKTFNNTADDPLHNGIRLTIQHTARNTLSMTGPIFVTFDTALFRCPMPAPFVYTLFPLAAPKSSWGIDVGLLQMSGAAASALAGMPSVSAQLGMLAPLPLMTRCESTNLTDTVDGLRNPTGFAFGDVWGAPQRGVLVGSVVIVCGFVVLLLTWASMRMWYYCIVGKIKGRPWPPTYRHEVRTLGLPGVLLHASSLVMVSTVSAGVALVVFGEVLGDQIVGGLVLAVCLGYIISVFVITVCGNVRPPRDDDDDDEIVDFDADARTNGNANASTDVKKEAEFTALDLPSNEAPPCKVSKKQNDTELSELTVPQTNDGSFSEASMDPLVGVISLDVVSSDGALPEKAAIDVPPQQGPITPSPPDCTHHTCTNTSQRALLAQQHMRLARWCAPHGEFGGDRRFRRLFPAYIARLRAVRYYRALELLMVFALAALQSAAYDVFDACVGQSSAVLGILVIFFIFVAIRRPMAARIEFVCTLLALLCHITSVAVIIVNHCRQEQLLEDISTLFIILATIASLAQTLVMVGVFTVSRLGTLSTDVSSFVAAVGRYRNRLADYYLPDPDFFYISEGEATDDEEDDDVELGEVEMNDESNNSVAEGDDGSPRPTNTVGDDVYASLMATASPPPQLPIISDDEFDVLPSYEPPIPWLAADEDGGLKRRSKDVDGSNKKRPKKKGTVDDDESDRLATIRDRQMALFSSGHLSASTAGFDLTEALLMVEAAATDMRTGVMDGPTVSAAMLKKAQKLRRTHQQQHHQQNNEDEGNDEYADAYANNNTFDSYQSVAIAAATETCNGAEENGTTNSSARSSSNSNNSGVANKKTHHGADGGLGALLHHFDDTDLSLLAVVEHAANADTYRHQQCAAMAAAYKERLRQRNLTVGTMVCDDDDDDEDGGDEYRSHRRRSKKSRRGRSYSTSHRHRHTEDTPHHQTAGAPAVDFDSL